MEGSLVAAASAWVLSTSHGFRSGYTTTRKETSISWKFGSSWGTKKTWFPEAVSRKFSRHFFARDFRKIFCIFTFVFVGRWMKFDLCIVFKWVGGEEPTALSCMGQKLHHDLSWAKKGCGLMAWYNDLSGCCFFCFSPIRVIPSRELTYPPKNGIFDDDFFPNFPRWDMLISRMVSFPGTNISHHGEVGTNHHLQKGAGLRLVGSGMTVMSERCRPSPRREWDDCHVRKVPAFASSGVGWLSCQKGAGLRLVGSGMTVMSERCRPSPRREWDDCHVRKVPAFASSGVGWLSCQKGAGLRLVGSGMTVMSVPREL